MSVEGCDAEGCDAESPSGMSLSGVRCYRGLAAGPRAAREAVKPLSFWRYPTKFPKVIFEGGYNICINCAIYCAIKGVFARNNIAQ